MRSTPAWQERQKRLHPLGGEARRRGRAGLELGGGLVVTTGAVQGVVRVLEALAAAPDPVGRCPAAGPPAGARRRRSRCPGRGAAGARREDDEPEVLLALLVAGAATAREDGMRFVARREDRRPPGTEPLGPALVAVQAALPGVRIQHGVVGGGRAVPDRAGPRGRPGRKGRGCAWRGLRSLLLPQLFDRGVHDEDAFALKNA